MNEIKYELDKYIGDTTDISNRIKQSVKMPSRQKKKSNGFAWVASIAALLIIGIISYSFFTGGNNTPPIAAPADPNEGTPITANPLKSMFHENGVYSYFAGDIGEYSSYTQVTYWLDDNHVQLVRDNTGGITTEIYRITDKEIQLLFSGMHNEGNSDAFKKIENYKDFSNFYVAQGELPFDPTTELSLTLTEALESFKVQNIYFSLPLEIGQTVGDYTVVDILDELMVAQGLYKEVYMLEKTEDDFVYTQYFANPGGFIKWNHKMISDEFEISGELQTIHGDWAKSTNTPVEIKNVDGTSTKQIILNDFQIIKQLLLTQHMAVNSLKDMYYIDIPSAISSKQSYLLEVPMNELTYYSFFIVEDTNGVRVKPLGMTLKAEENPIIPEQFSPTGQYFIYKLNSAFGENPLSYTITQLVILDLVNSTIVYPNNPSMIFDIQSIPITTIEWKDHRTFKVGVADIGENSYYEIEQWYKNEQRPVNYIDFTLE